MARGFLLPDGCKDLIDALRLKPHPESVIGLSIEIPPKPWFKPTGESSKYAAPFYASAVEIVISEKTSVGQLATLLGQKPFQIIADLMELGIFASVSQAISVEMIARVARKYGFTVKKAP